MPDLPPVSDLDRPAFEDEPLLIRHRPGVAPGPLARGSADAYRSPLESRRCLTAEDLATIRLRPLTPAEVEVVRGRPLEARTTWRGRCLEEGVAVGLVGDEGEEQG